MVGSMRYVSQIFTKTAFFSLIFTRSLRNSLKTMSIRRMLKLVPSEITIVPSKISKLNYSGEKSRSRV